MGNDHDDDDDDEIVKKVPIKMLWRETQLKGDLLSRFIFDTNLTIQVSCSTIHNSSVAVSTANERIVSTEKNRDV